MNLAHPHDLTDLDLVVIETDPHLGQAIVNRLAAAGWNAVLGGGLHEVAAVVNRERPDAVVLGPTFLASGPDALTAARRALPGIPLVDLASSTGLDGEARTILDGLPTPVLSFRLDGARPHLAWCNPAVESWLGRRTRDLLAKPDLFWGHVHGDDIAALEAWFRAPTTERTTIRVRFLSVHGQASVANVHATARGGRPGAPVCADLVLEDASQEVALASAVATHRSQVAALVQRSDEVVFQLRLRPLTVAWVNDAAPKLLGLEPSALREDAGMLFDAILPEDRERVEAALQEAVSGPVDVRFRVHRAQGVATIGLTLKPLRGTTSALMAIGREISDEEQSDHGAASTTGVVEVARARTLAAARSLAEARAAASATVVPVAEPAASDRSSTTAEAARTGPARPVLDDGPGMDELTPVRNDELSRMIEVV